MRTIVLRNNDERTPGDSSAGEERRVTLFFPVTGDEYKQTRAAVEGVTPVGEEGSGPAGTPAGGRYVVTTDQQRREWGLADLANGPGGDAAAPGDPDAMERAGAVSAVDSADALTCSRPSVSGTSCGTTSDWHTSAKRSTPVRRVRGALAIGLVDVGPAVGL